MKSTLSASALFFFSFALTICLLYSSQFFTVRTKLDGFSCADSDSGFIIENVYSEIQCAFLCKRELFCSEIFYQLQTRRCRGCKHATEKSDDETRVDCGIPPYIDYGKIILNSGTNVTDTADVVCDTSFRASSNTIMCTSNGTWTKATCEEYDCHTGLRKYKGKKNQTKDGVTCERWDDNRDNQLVDVTLMPETTLSEAENYCRCPTYSFSHLFCLITTESGKVQSSCGIWKC